MKTKYIPSTTVRKRKQVLILAASIPSPLISRSEKTFYDTLAAVSGDHTVLCVPEEKPLSARLDEAALTSRGLNIYAFPSVTRREIADRVKTLITTANPELEIIGVFGLETMKRHLLDARLFAPTKTFFAVLTSAETDALTREPGDGSPRDIEAFDKDRHLLSCCDAVFCETDRDAELLRRMFLVNAHNLAGISGILAGISGRQKCQLERIGVISPSSTAPSGAFRNSFEAVHRAKSAGFGEMNRLIFDSDDIPAWAVINRPFSSCGTFWPRLNEVFHIFMNAGMLLPSLAIPRKPGDARFSRMQLEADSLKKQGIYSEPLLIGDLPLVILRSEAFKRVGGFDTRFSSPGCAWTDLGLRMRQAGFRVITAEDVALSARIPGAAAKTPPEAEELDIELLTHKWCADGLLIMELLVPELGGRPRPFGREIEAGSHTLGPISKGVDPKKRGRP